MSHVPCCLRNLLLDQTNMASVQVVDYIVLNRGKIDFLHALLYHNRPCMTILKKYPAFHDNRYLCFRNNGSNKQRYSYSVFPGQSTYGMVGGFATSFLANLFRSFVKYTFTYGNLSVS